MISEGRPGVGRGQRHDHSTNYLIPLELRRELPVEQIVLVQAETFVDQSVLRRRRRKEMKKRMSRIGRERERERGSEAKT